MIAGERQQIGFADVAHGWVGLLFIAVAWPLNWLLPDYSFRTAYLFFPLWFGYILCVDALVFMRTGESLLVRSPYHFVLLFAASAPAWWIFELINLRTQNWEYLGSTAFTRLEYNVLCTISFSTVMPAVFETAELVSTFRWTKPLRGGPPLDAMKFRNRAFAIGVAALALTLLWPQYFYPLVWGALFLVIEPINSILGRRGLFHSLADGNWLPFISLALGALICGFFWEMWNYFSYPKWIYHTPGAQFLHIFEMPLLGYLGYLPFAWELYALATLLVPGAMTSVRFHPTDHLRTDR